MADLITKSSLYQEFDRRARRKDALALELRGLIDSSLQSLEVTLNEVRRWFHAYTDHAATHSGRVLVNMSRLLSATQIRQLSTVELYLLIASAMVHDIGMVVSDKEVAELLKDDAYQEERRSVCTHLGIDKSDTEDGFGLFRLVVAEWFRKRHGKRCSFKLSEGLNGCRQLTGGHQDLARKLAVICVGHTLTRDVIAASTEYPTSVQVRSDEINVLFCTILLRLGDLLDITTERASPVLRELSEPLESLSAAHWDQYSSIEIGGLRPCRPIRISGTCPTQAAERLLREWVSWLESECEWASLTLNTGDSLRYRLNLGRVVYEVKPEAGADGRPRYEFHNYRFNLDEEEVFRKLFGTRLYGRPDAALRELVQNAIDATRVRAVVACSADASWETAPESEKRSRYIAYLDANTDRFSIHVTLSCNINDRTGREEVWLMVADSGVGMSREVIEKYLLKVGRSRWREDPRTRSLGIGTIGEFGIGFISAFMISDRIEIETQSCVPTEEGIRASIYSWRGYLATEPASNSLPGTRVRLLLRADIVDYLRDLPGLCAHWFPFPEVPIVITSPDGGRTTIPVRGRAGYSQEEHRIYFRIGEGLSFATICEERSPIAKAMPPCLAQEGIALPDVPPPVLDMPEQKILREHGLRVNLFGNDTIRLDLSRKITEGGYDQLWSRLVPVIWNGLTRHSLRTKACSIALTSLVQSRFEESKGSCVVMLKAEHELLVCDIRELPTIPDISFVDHRKPYLDGPANDGFEHLLVLPDAPVAMTSGIEVDESTMAPAADEQTKYWALLGGHIREHFRELALEWLANDTPDSEDTEPLTLEEIRRRRDSVDMISPAAEGFDNNGAVSLLTFLKYYGVLFREYRFVTRSRGGYARLHRDRPPGKLAYPLRDLILFRLTAAWWAIRNPISGDWMMVSIDDLQLAEQGIPPQDIASFSLERVALVYLYDFWPNVDAWRPIVSGEPPRDYADLTRMAIEQAMNERIGDEPLDDDYDDDRAESDEPSWGSEEDEEAESQSDDELESRVSLSPDELRRIDRHGVSSDQVESILSEFVSGVLPRIDTSSLRTKVTEWDRHDWDVRRKELRQARKR